MQPASKALTELALAYTLSGMLPVLCLAAVDAEHMTSRVH